MPVLKGISLAALKGLNSALVGPSGSGKSTIVALLERFYDPNSGSLYCEGIELPKWNLRYLRSQLSIVSQEPTLFNGTIMVQLQRMLPKKKSKQLLKTPICTISLQKFQIHN